MESIVSIVVLIAVYSLIAIVKVILSKDGGVEAKPVMGEAFPEIEHLEPEETLEEPSIVKNIGKKSKVRDFAKLSDNRTLSFESDAEAPESVSIERRNSDKVIMKSKSDAKRAFIYSEVFNRKY
ncbi:MAG: hypothetical protein IKJ23_04245 [Bacteroidaceae bacterium]|nr:hypothetical protein [Bacteroidaceae bacterium]